MKAPQITYLILVGISLTVGFIRDGTPKEGRYSFKEEVVAIALQMGIMWWGGFFHE